MEATITETARMTKEFPEMDYMMVNPPSLEYPRLRSFLFFGDEDPTKEGTGRIQAWCSPGLQDLHKVDKEYSRTAALRAIPQLINEINVLREPEEAAQRFRFKMALGQNISIPGVPVKIVNRGDDEPVADYLDRILNLSVGWNGGSGS